MRGEDESQTEAVGAAVAASAKMVGKSSSALRLHEAIFGVRKESWEGNLFMGILLILALGPWVRSRSTLAPFSAII